MSDLSPLSGVKLKSDFGAGRSAFGPDTRSGRGYLARSDQGRHLSSLKSASRLAKGLTAAGLGIASTAIIGLYWN
jgi:hypothetical protein